MSIILAFQNYLESLEPKPSSITVKNYLSDIRHFINWYEKSFHKDFFAEDLTPEVISLYTKSYGSTVSQDGFEIIDSALASKSLKRHLSTLRKFSVFLLSEDIIPESLIEERKQDNQEDIWQLAAFKRSLSEQNSSALTIKNYISDLSHFTQWAEQKVKEHVEHPTPSDFINTISSDDLDTYQLVLRQSGFSKASINRKLSSLRKYLNFLGKTVEPSQYMISNPAPSFLLQDLVDNNSKITTRQYSGFLPFRLAQKVFESYTGLEEKTANIFSNKKDFDNSTDGWTAWNGSRKSRTRQTLESTSAKEGMARHSDLKNGIHTRNNQSITNKMSFISSGFNAYSREIPPEPDSAFGKLVHTFRHKRPAWYHTYHSYSVTHYFHLALLILCGTIATAAAYQSYYSPRNNQLYAAENVRLIPFTGKIESAQGGNLPQQQSITFALYNDSQNSNNTLLWKETQPSVKINPDGTFTTLIGSSSEIPEKLFQENDNIFLGIQIGSGPELKPRKQLASMGYSLDSATLANMLPITDPSQPSYNAVVTLDSAGDIVLPGDASHTFKAAAGDLTLSGETLSLTTNPGTDSNVVISPDGNGAIDLQKPLINTTDNGVISRGAVEVQDSFAVNAQNEFEPALLVNSNGTGDLLVASSSGSTKFVVTNSGNVGIGTDSPNLPLNVRGSASITDRLGIGTLLPAADLDVRGESAIFSGSKDFTINILKSSASSSAQIKFHDDLGDRASIGLINNNNLSLQVTDNSGQLRNGVVIDNSNGNVGIGTTNISDRLTVAGNITPDEGNKYNLGSESRRFDKLYVNQIIGPTVGVQGFWQRNGTALAPTTVTDAMLLGSSVESSALIKLSGTANTNSWINSGRLGIGTTTPGFKLDVSDTQESDSITRITNTSTNLDADVLALKVGATTPQTSNYFLSFQNGSGQTIGKVQGNGSGGVTYSTTGADFAEYYRKENSAEEMDVGDVVCLGPTGGVTRCNTTNTRLVGVISGQAGFVGNSKFDGNSTYALVGLLGQISVKTVNDGSLKVGDELTVSEIPGKAKKATTAGIIIGRITSLSTTNGAGDVKNFTGGPKRGTPVEPPQQSEEVERGCEGTGPDCIVEISLNPTWYDPDVFLSSTGDVTIGFDSSQTVYDGTLEDQSSQIKNQNYSLNIKDHAITQVAAFAQLAAGKIQAGLIQTKNAVVENTLTAKNVVVDNLTIQGQPLNEYIAAQIQNSSFITPHSPIISPLASINEVRTNTISPLDGNGVKVEVGTKTDASNSGQLAVTSNGQTVASIDSSGNTSLSGQLQANSANINGSVNSDQLNVTQDATISGKLTVHEIDAHSINGLNQQIATLMQENIEAIRNSHSSDHSEFSELPDAPSSLSNLSADFVTVQQGLVSFGPATFNQASVMDSFSIGTDWTFQNHAINVIGQDLEVQPLKQGGISFLAGLITINKEGTMNIEGDLHVKGTVYASNSQVDKLKAKVISPVADDDLVVQLGDNQSASDSAAIHNSSFIIHNSAEDSSVFGVNAKGDVQASGSATISKLNLSVAGQAYAVSDTESVATGSAGTARIRANRPEMTIYTPAVTENSLIYITPVGNTSQPLYLLRQTARESFTVGISKLSTVDVPFNWIIIN